MAWTRQLKSGNFQGCYRDANGDEQSAGTYTQRAEALRKAGAKEDEQRGPLALDVKGGKIHWSAWFEVWHDSRVLSFATDDSYRSIAANHIDPQFGRTALADITQIEVAKWVKGMLHPRRGQKPKSPWVVRGALMLLKTSLNAAVDAKRLAVNPAKKVPYPDLPTGLERFLTPDEVEAMAFYLDGPNSLLLWTGVQTGLRFGEMAGLHWHRLDLDRGVVQVVEKYNQKSGLIDPLPKDKEQRTVPIPDDLRTLLRQYREHAAPERQSTCGIDHVSGRCGSDLVFRGPRGAVLKSNEWGRGPFKRALDLAGIEGRVRPHDLRHTYASWLIQERISIAELSELLGHSDWETTKRYAHLADHGHDDVRSALTRRRAAARAANYPETGPNEAKLEVVG